MKEHMPKIHIAKIINYWVKNSDHKWETVQFLMKGKRYADALFFCHLSLECLLKALFVARKREPAPFYHDLIVLADKAAVHLSAIQQEDLKEISAFNIEARYPDERLAIYKRATKAKAETYYKKSSQYHLWLKNLVSKEKVR